MPKIFILACEASGDRHGAHLVEALRRLDSSLTFEGLGGPAMRDAGVQLLHEITHLSVLGFGDVLKKYFKFRRVFYQALRDVRKSRPDLLVLIDSPAFNLRFAKKIRRSIPTVYYIAPQIWAWGGRRIHTLRRNVDQVIAILPFEEKFYREAGVPCTFVGHPLLDWVKPSQNREALRKEFSVAADERALVLVPGSREPEVQRIFPIMLESIKRLEKELPRLRFFLTEAPSVSPSVYDTLLQKYSELRVERFRHRLYDVVHLADFALVASGTATLETALLGTPYFLLYKASATTFFLGRRLVKIPYLGLVNVLAGRPVIPEFIQHLADPDKIAHETKVLLENPDLREKFQSQIHEALESLGSPGATDRAAHLIAEKWLSRKVTVTFRDGHLSRASSGTTKTA